jgi:hypothetical protein
VRAPSSIDNPHSRCTRLVEMFDDFTAYFYENVLSAFNAYRETKEKMIVGRSRDIRSAVDAATALFHLREHLPPLYKLKRADVEKLCSDFGLLADLVNAAKHASVTDSTPHGPPLIGSANDIVEEVCVTLYEDTKGPYSFAEKRVVVKLKDGTEKDVADVLTNVMNFWQNHLHARGLIPSIQTFGSVSSPVFRHRDECAPMDLEIARGLRFRSRWRLQKFNPASGRVEPVNLNGAESVFRLYPKNVRFELSVKNAQTGAEAKRVVELNVEDTETVRGLSTDSQREAFIMALPHSQDVLKQLASEAGLV